MRWIISIASTSGAERATFHLPASDANKPAQYYLVSYPAHAAHPTVQAKKAQAAAVNLGTPATCNQRTIYKYIHPAGIQSCQLVMGFTQLAVGSAWNTMPPHTHMRRSEVYMYFDMAADARVFHFMGPPLETRHLVMADRQVPYLQAGRSTAASAPGRTASAGPWAAKIRRSMIWTGCRLRYTVNQIVTIRALWTPSFRAALPSCLSSVASGKCRRNASSR